MSRYSNKELIAEIQNGNEEILVYLTGKYFSQVRRILRMRGWKDSLSPEIFATVLIRVWFDVSGPGFSPSVDLETFFFNSLQDYLTELRKKNQLDLSNDPFSTDQKEVVSQCVSILDEQARNIVHARYAGHLSFEQIASRFNYSDAVIAQHEVNKAMNQLEGIVKLRLNISLN